MAKKVTKPAKSHDPKTNPALLEILAAVDKVNKAHAKAEKALHRLEVQARDLWALFEDRAGITPWQSMLVRRKKHKTKKQCGLCTNPQDPAFAPYCSEICQQTDAAVRKADALRD